ncbi:MAG: hypothetical protein ACREOW_07890 [Thermodesulfobacteriota bacterium]
MKFNWNQTIPDKTMSIKTMWFVISGSERSAEPFALRLRRELSRTAHERDRSDVTENSGASSQNSEENF